MRLALSLAALLAAPVSAQTPCASEPDGWRLRACLRAAHSPTALLSAENATRALVTSVAVRVRRDSTLRTDSTFVPADSTWTVEEWWEVTETPYLSAIDDTTTAHPPGALPHAWTAHVPERVAVLQAHAVGTPLPADALPPPGYGHLDLHAAHLSASGGVVLDDRRGDIARAALYLRTVYPLHIEAAGTWPASAHARNVEALLADHEADLPDDNERDRHDRAATAQGNANPFVLDAALARRAFPLGPRVDREAPPLWVNEVHATNAGRDTGEGVEVAGPALTDLAGWRLVLYGGRGHPYDPYDDAVTATPALSGALPTEGSLGAAWLPVRGMWNRCNGVALFDPDATLVQFVSYGGCQFNAATGPVADAAEAVAAGGSDPAHPDSLAWTNPTRDARGRALQEWDEMPAGYSLQLTGAGASAADFSWGGPHPASPGRLNDYQAPASGANASTGWASRDAVPAPLAPVANRQVDAVSATNTDPIYPGLVGPDLLAALAADYSPAFTFGYDRARDSLFAVVWREPLEDTGAASDSLRGFYTGLAIGLPRGVDPTTHAWQSSPRFSTEHLWPVSRGAAEGTPLHADLHALVPVQQSVNSARSNHPLGEVPDAQAARWYGPGGGSSSAVPPTATRDAYSERRSAPLPLFEPREDRSGDAARALFYAWTVYGPHGGPLDEGRLDTPFWKAQLAHLLDWHGQDPPDSDERRRSQAIAAWQGTANPFVLDSSLARRAFAQAPTTTETSPATPPTLSRPRPNPAARQATVTLHLPRPAWVRVRVLDVLGREITTVHDGPAHGETPLTVPTDRLAPGVYTLVVTLPSAAPLSRTLTVVR